MNLLQCFLECAKYPYKMRIAVQLVQITFYFAAFPDWPLIDRIDRIAFPDFM